MKKVLFAAILSCYLLSMAIVPINVGNKWYYYCSYTPLTGENAYDTVKFVKVSMVDKDTLINQVVCKKIVNSYSISFDSLFLGYFFEETPMSELWYEQDSVFHGGLNFIYNDRITIQTYNFTYFSNDYTYQVKRWGGHSNTSYSVGNTITAKNLGPVQYLFKRDGIMGAWPQIDVKITLVAAIIDGEYIGDSLAVATTAISEPLADVKIPILLSNYPNPFNPTTAITFALNRAQTAKLVVYNSRGEAVRVLADQYFTAGQHSVNFDGAGLNSGVYFYQLETSGVKTTGKMLMLK